MSALFIILTAVFIALSCGLLGVFLVLRKMSMVGDAISHAVLPGIVLAFLISGARESLPMLVGAAATGVLTTVLIEWLHKTGRLPGDSAIGIVFTALFALGVVLISLFAGQVDLDQDCVLYGEIAYVPLDLWYTSSGISLGPRPLWVAGGLLLFLTGFVWLGYKGLKITTFDPGYAAALGISTGFWHYALMSAVSLTTVLSFESVGAILVVGFLIIPPATAYLITDQLSRMILFTAIFGIFSAIAGYFLAAWLDGSVAGAMSTVAGLTFLAVLLFKPKKQLPENPNFEVKSRSDAQPG